VRLDVTSEADWERAVAFAVERFGRLDVLVNNAAVLHLASLEDTALADFERVVRVNQIGPFLGMRAAAPALRAAGGGSIVNVASVDGLQGKNGVVAYAASKWALRGMSKVAAAELGRHGIRVNAVCPEAGSAEMIAPYVPAGVDPRSVHAFGQPFLRYQRERTVEERLRDVALMILFLASDESRSCTGGDFPVDGGNASLRRAKGAPGG
jgi:3alpha(or 20beta)-hydroxysteroid dehydrogenase